MPDEKALDESLAAYTDKLLAQDASNPIPEGLEDEAKLVQSLQRLVSSKPNAQARQALGNKLAKAFDANEGEKFRRKNLPFYKRYPMQTGTAAAVLLLLVGVASMYQTNSASTLTGTSIGNLDFLTLAFFLLFALGGLAAAYWLNRKK